MITSMLNMTLTVFKDEIACHGHGGYSDYSLWRDRYDKSHEVSEMTIGHILSIISMIDNREFEDEWLSDYGERWNEVFKNELNMRVGNVT